MNEENQGPGSPTGPAIEFRAVSYLADGGKALVSDVSLSVERGETLVLLGRSGAGKTTLLKLINRLLVPTRGEVLYAGKPTTEWDPILLRRKIASRSSVSTAKSRRKSAGVRRFSPASSATNR